MSSLYKLRSRCLVTFASWSKTCQGLSFIILTSTLFAANSPWQNATPEELAQTESSIEPGVAAEAILRRIEIDDSGYPLNRTIKEYIRYKIFDPQKADRILRLSKKSVSLEGVDFQAGAMKARLTQPDGSTKEFGAESVHERQVVKDATSDTFLHRVFGSDGLEVKEKFLAVGGALPGAILEFQTTDEQQWAPPVTFIPPQIPSIPIRKFEYFQEPTSNTDNFAFQFFTLNGGEPDAKNEKAKKTVTFTRKNLPSLRSEPLSGASPYYAPTLVSCYTRLRYTTLKVSSKTRHFSPEFPWAPVATIENWRAEEHISITGTVKKTAAEITQGASSEIEKARRIHDYVSQLHTRYIRQRNNRSTVIYDLDIVSMEDVINFEKRLPEKLTSSDFLWLAVSLYRAAGLRAEIVLVPNRRIVPFNRSIVSKAFIQDICAGVEIGGAWHFSSPLARPSLAFDELTWEHEGQGGLLALDNKQQFVEVPLSQPERSSASNTGTFQLTADGVLQGQCKLVFTGHEAYRIRALLSGRPKERQLNVARANLRRQFQGVDVVVTEISNVEDPYKPVEVSYAMRWPGFAVAADQRLIFHPFVFRNHSASPFSATERTHPVIFDFLHVENDDAIITLPPGYELEVKNAPPSAPGKALSYVVDLTFNAKTRQLHAKRTLSSGILAVGVKDYPTLKKWYDEISTSDQHQLVLVRKAAPLPSPSPTASAP